MSTSLNMHQHDSSSGRLVQVDSRKRMTLPSLYPHTTYFARCNDDGTLLIWPRRVVRSGGRLVRVDARKRLTIYEMEAGALYLAHELDDGTVVLEPAVVLPRKTMNAWRERITA